jgi:hypothetical protein
MPAPSRVNGYVFPPTAPLHVRVPDEVAVIVAPKDPKVIAPLKAALPPVLVSAPDGEAVNPIPFRVSDSAFERVNPFKSRTAPEVTDVIPAPVPSTVVDAPSFSVPEATVVLPV